MKILFDLNHPADVNFFKNAINELHMQGNSVEITFRERGKLETILRHELNGFTINKVGRHKKSLIKKFIFQLYRDFLMISFLKEKKIDLVLCFGPTSAIAARILGIPFLAFDDDYEYKIPFFHANLFATKHIYPDFISYNSKKTVKYHGFKELAYLHPKYFKTNESVLSKYGVKPNKYVFIREISNVSLNYQENSSILKELVNKIKMKGLSIVLSLEDKKLTDSYIDDCIILEEPVSDIYSLLYYSLFAVSSGDTVARETALLGVPTIYTGGRTMVVNEALVEAGLMFESTNVKSIVEFMDTLTIAKKKENRESSLKLIENKWENTTSVILKHTGDFLPQ